MNREMRLLAIIIVIATLTNGSQDEISSKKEVELSFCFSKSKLDFLRHAVHQCHCEPLDEKQFPHQTSLLFYEVKGRLGNQMLAYAFLFGAKSALGLRTFMEEEHLKRIKYYFPRADKIARIESLCQSDYPWAYFHHSVDHMANMRFGRAIAIAPRTRLMGNNINGRAKWNLFLNPVEKQIRDAFRFDDKFTAKAEEILESAKQKYIKSRKSSSKKPKDLTFIGIHIRKTDADRNYVRMYNLPALNPSYYLQAIDLYRQNFKHTVFVVCSDDMDWVRTKLLPRVGSAAVYPLGDGRPGDPDAIGTDLATLSRCNHTILSYGTFSFWAGFLAGGLRVIPSTILGGRQRRKDSHLFDSNSSLGPFDLTDKGLVYYSDREKRFMKTGVADE